MRPSEPKGPVTNQGTPPDSRGVAAGETASDLLDRIRPNWREEAAACGAHWRKTFQTPSARTLAARQEEAAVKAGIGSAERQRRLCAM